LCEFGASWVADCGLDVRGTFYFDRSVPADDQVTSLTGVGGSAHWALTLLEQVLTRLESEYRSAGNAKLFDSLKEFLSDEPGRPSQGEVAAELGMTENAVKQAFHRLRQR
jgi:hypothetical protein